MNLPEHGSRTRWVAAAATVAVVGGGALVATSAQASPKLPPRTAQQLLVDLQSPTVHTLSGTVRTRADLGLPALPTTSSSSGTGDLTGLLAGDHTLRVWVDGADRSRVSVIGNNQETSVIRNGTDVWTYSSADRSATHVKLPADQQAAKNAHTPPTGAPTTPQQAADQLLAAVGPSTQVTTSDTARVAGRPAYELVLTPAAGEDTKVASVRIAVDAETHAVLDVTVLAKGDSRPALEIGYSKVDFATPAAGMFTFTPPAGTSVKDQAVPQRTAPTGHTPATTPGQQKPTVVGKGWDQVVVTKLDPSTLGSATTQNAQAKQLLDSLPRVSGSWGSGRVLSGTLFSAVLTDDGRVAVGAVPTQRLLDALH